MKKFLLATAALLAGIAGVSTADLPVYKAPPPGNEAAAGAFFMPTDAGRGETILGKGVSQLRRT